MPVKEKDDDIIIRIPRKLYSKELQNMLHLIEQKKIVSKSKATEKVINNILTSIKKERGKKVRSYLKERGVIIK